MLPKWFRMGALALLFLILLGVVVTELVTKDYEIQPLALALIGAIGAGIGGRAKRRGEDE